MALVFQKHIYFVLAVVLLFLCFPVLSSGAKEKCKVGYGWATTVMSQENQDHFFLGFEYGLKKTFESFRPADGPCQSFEDIELIKYDNSKFTGPLDAVKAASNLVAKGVLLYAGFPTSHEALLAARVAQNSKIAFVSLGAVANDLAPYKDYVFTTSPKRAHYEEELMRGLIKRHKGDELLIVAKKDLVFSMDILASLKRENEKMGSPLILTPVFVQKNLALEEDVLNKIDFAKVSGVYITLYSADSRLTFLELARRLKPDAGIYVSSSWVSHRVDFFDEVPLATKERVVAFGAGVPQMHNSKLDELKQLYFEKFGQTSATEVFEGYEGAVFAAHVLYNAKVATREAVLDSLRELKCVSVLTRDKLCRGEEGYSTKQLYFYRWTKNGYVPEGV